MALFKLDMKSASDFYLLLKNFNFRIGLLGGGMIAKFIRLAYVTGLILVIITLTVLSLYQPYYWKMKNEQGAFIASQIDKGRLGRGLSGGIVHPEGRADIEEGMRLHFKNLANEAELTPALRHVAGFVLTVVSSIALICAFVYRRKKRLSAISDRLLRRKFMLSIYIIPLIVGYGFGLIFLVGLSLIRSCWANPSCEANKLVIPLVLSLAFMGLAVLVFETTFWWRHFRDKFDSQRGPG